MRLFVAVWPPPAVVEQLGAIERPAHPGIRWTTAGQWHVTLRFLGSVSDESVEDLKTALVALGSLERSGTPASSAAWPPWAEAGPALARLGSSILCLPVAGLDFLATEVNHLTADIGDAAHDDRPFRGHLTIARARRVKPLPSMPVPFSVGWAVEEVTLVASTLHSDGARYEVLSRVALTS